MTALDVTRLGQRQRWSSVASLLLVRGAGRWTFFKGDIAELRAMLIGMKRTATGQGLEEKGGETGDPVVGLKEQENGE